jgi:uncharacterized membrane protein YjjP (DUF1212 family)
MDSRDPQLSPLQLPGDMPPHSRDGDSSQNTSAATTRPGSPHGKPRERKRVGFTQGDTSGESSRGRSRDEPLSPHAPSGSLHPQSGSGSSDHSRRPSDSNLADFADFNSGRPSDVEIARQVHKAFGEPYIPKPRPAIRKSGLGPPQTLADDERFEQLDNHEKRRSGIQAQERAQKLARNVEAWSSASSRRNSMDRGQTRPDSIPLLNLQTHMGVDDDTDEDDEKLEQTNQLYRDLRQAAGKLVASHTHGHGFTPHAEAALGLRSGQVTPRSEQENIADYVPPPSKYRGGVLSSLLKLYGGQGADSPHSRPASGVFSGTTATPSMTPQHSPPGSGTSTPRRPLRPWHHRSSHSASSLAQLIGSSSVLATPVQKDFGEDVPGRVKRLHAEGGARKHSKPSREDRYRITKHIAEIMARQRYLQKLCRALMLYGAPTHRLEEYMKMSARVLEIEGQFLYIPGCMIISFDDVQTHTTEVKIIRSPQGVDLGRLRDTHEIYKNVVHDRMGVDEATAQLTEVMARKPKYAAWILVPVYGLASAMVGPFAFQARLIDMPIAFLLGSILGILQLIVSPRSDLYANVFEISATIITSFLARAFGSIHNGELFCFSALAQSSIALILPGYVVLCGSLELQSKSIVAGSVRMVYAIIYSLFIGYGITIGTAIYGWIDKNATSATQCQDPMDEHYYFIFVPLFTMCLITINQAKWRQAPAMMFIAICGYVVNFFSSKSLAGNAQVSNTLGAFTIGLLANMYSRVGRYVDNFFLDVLEKHILPRWHAFRGRRLQKRSPHAIHDEEQGPATQEPRPRKVGYGLAAAAMLPAIFVQVPSGIAVGGSLVSGITSANQITGNATGTTTVSNAANASDSVNSTAFTVGFSVIQVAIGITVGLFMSAVFVYPLGKRRSGLFSF